jgi:hypothetical protein
MKKLLYLLIILPLLWSCQEESEKKPELNMFSKKLAKQAITDDVNSFQPPWSNPIMMELTNPKKELNKADSIYRAEIEKSNAKAYYLNLKQFGFIAMIEHGLIEEGTKEQKEFYINEQLSLEVNLLNFENFYALLSSSQVDFSKSELQDFAERFYSKNKNYIENNNNLKESDKNEDLEKLTVNYEAFQRNLK